MTESSVRPRQHEEEGNDKKKNHGALSSSPESLVTTTGHAILFCSDQLKRCDTTDTDQEDSCAYSTRAVWHFNTNNAQQQQQPSKQQHDVFQTRNRRYHHPRLAILGVTVTMLCAVITGVALVILIPRRSSRHSHHAGTNSSNVVGGNHNNNNNNGTSTNSNESINATTTNHNNDESNTTRPSRPNNTTTNETTDDDMLLTDDCASIETADAAWNAIAHYNNNTNNDDMQQDTLNATVSLLVVLGPMVGHVTETTAKIWAFVSNRDSHNNMSILYQRLGGNNNNGGNDCPSPKVQVTNISWNNQTTMELANLEPDTRYRFHVLVNDTKIGKMGTFATVPAEITKFRYVFGSCISFKRDANQTIWNHVLQQEPAFLILNGDTVYSDTMNYSKHWEYHSKQRQIPTFANIIRQVPVYASWDDHDYGPNDSDGLNSGKEQSLQAFTDLFPNPSFGTPTHPGIYSTFSYGNHVQFYIIDNRYHRMTDTTYAGPEQMQWLKQQLERSNAVFKIIVHGGTIRRAGSQSWFERSKLERRELLDWIASQNITGVVFHGGDIHKNLLNTHPKCPSNDTTRMDFEVFELVSSGLTNRGGCYTIVDIDTEERTLTYSMIQAGQEEERGRLTVLKEASGAMSHELLYRSQLMALELNECQQNLTRTTLAYPVIGGLEEV